MFLFCILNHSVQLQKQFNNNKNHDGKNQLECVILVIDSLIQNILPRTALNYFAFASSAREKKNLDKNIITYSTILNHATYLH